MAAIDGDDPVHHGDPELGIVVTGDLANVVAGLLTEQDQVAGMEVGQHAHAGRDHVSGGPADLGRGQSRPRRKAEGGANQGRPEAPTAELPAPAA